MKKISVFVPSLLGLMFISVPLSIASAQSLSIQSLTPGTSALAKSAVTFQIVASGFQARSFILSDSFSGSTARVSNIDPGGKFMWTPIVSDVGTHTFTISASDNSGATAQTTQTITVLPPPSISIHSVSPAGSIMPGTKYSFLVSANGFTNPSFIVADEFGGSSVPHSKVDSAGNFSWTPDISQNGSHRITVYATDTQGRGAQATVDVKVGAGPSIALLSIAPSTTVELGKTLTFTAIPSGFSPTGFSVSDSFKGTSVTGGHISSSGLFSWTPQGTEVGTHELTVSGTVGAYGESATVKQVFYVVRPGESPPVATTTTAAPAPVVATSTDPLAALQAQLAFLQARLAAQSGTGVTSTSQAPVTPSSAAKYVFTKLLIFGNRGTEVRELQARLVELGFLTAEPTGYFGAATREAVRQFQKANGIDVRGHVGPATRAALNK